MTCYVRHLAEFLPPNPSSQDKKALDAAVRIVVDLPDAHCPEIWAAVKAHRERSGFTERLRAQLASDGM